MRVEIRSKKLSLPTSKKTCMQLKGLVRFFTILLILYSIYELSFTWVVRSHENKMEARAKSYVSKIAPTASAEVKDSLTKIV